MEKILGHISSKLKEPLDKVETQMLSILTAGDVSLATVLTPLQKAGGKRIRPMLVILSAQCFSDRERSVPVAVCAELVHTASLMHDDVVDSSELRRGKPTLQTIWGNKVAILGGDHVFAKAIDLLVTLGDLRLLRAMAGMIATMGEGEILQIFHAYNTEQSEEDYFARIRRKTALFLSVCCEMGAIIGEATDEEIASMAEYGLNLGMAFQVEDDLLDFTGDEKATGKPVGSDLLEGNITIPVLHALKFSPEREKLRQMIRGRSMSRNDMENVQEILRQSESLEYAKKVAERFTKQAVGSLERIKDSVAKQMMLDLAKYSVARGA